MQRKIHHIPRIAGLFVVGIATTLACDVGSPEQVAEVRAKQELRYEQAPADTEIEVSSAPQEMQASTCRAGFRHRGPRLCISALQSPQDFQTASWNCRRKKSRVCSFEDLSYLYWETSADAEYDPHDKWIGNVVDRWHVLCGVRHVDFDDDPNIYFFENACAREGAYSYWCCHDDAV